MLMHGKAIVLEGKVVTVAIFSDHHGVCQLWVPITFKSLESFQLPIPHLNDPINICLEPKVQVGGMSLRCILSKSNYPQIST